MLGSHNFNEATLVRAWRLATETPVGAEARLLQRSHARESVETRIARCVPSAPWILQRSHARESVETALPMSATKADQELQRSHARESVETPRSIGFAPQRASTSTKPRS